MTVSTRGDSGKILKLASAKKLTRIYVNFIHKKVLLETIAIFLVKIILVIQGSRGGWFEF